MKKSTMGMMMAALMMGAVANPVNAADNTTEVTYTKVSEYVITIPASVALKTDEEVSVEIKAETMNVEPTKKVQVSVASGISEGAVTLTRKDASDTTTSVVSLTSGGAGIGDQEVVATFTDQNTTAEVGTGKLYFAKLPEDLQAGTWSGQIVFNIETVDR